MITNTENKQLSAKCIKTLLDLNYDEKVRLFARLKIFEQNRQISGIIYNTISKEYLAQMKYEITHQLYDGNNSDRYKYEYADLSKKMREKNGAIPYFDAYTMCAYAIYYGKFIEFSENAKNYNDLCDAKTNALTYVRKNCDFDRSRLCLDYDEKKHNITVLLNAEYRKSVVEYLEKDLNIKDSFEFLKFNMKNDYSDGIEEEVAQAFAIENDKIYANNVEEYRDENGNVYYLDADGNNYESDEIADFNYNGYSLSATKDGFKVSQKENNDELTK